MKKRSYFKLVFVRWWFDVTWIGTDVAVCWGQWPHTMSYFQIRSDPPPPICFCLIFLQSDIFESHLKSYTCLYYYFYILYFTFCIDTSHTHTYTVSTVMVYFLIFYCIVIKLPIRVKRRTCFARLFQLYDFGGFSSVNQVDVVTRCSSRHSGLEGNKALNVVIVSFC